MHFVGSSFLRSETTLRMSPWFSRYYTAVPTAIPSPMETGKRTPAPTYGDRAYRILNIIAVGILVIYLGMLALHLLGIF